MPRKSLAARAVMAVLLTIGFYTLALGIVAALLGAVYAELVYADRIVLKPTIFAIVAAGMILWSILPRIDRFAAPGPRLDEADQPELFAVLRDVSAATGEEMPSEVYLLGAEVNAWVAQRGGLMGIGSRRVMAVGLPLLESVTVPQFRAIVAHEFGHFHGSDTKLGPWIYKTRQAIVRTVNLVGRNSSFLHKPFVWYGNFFLRVTQGISRAQELAADALAAQVAGARTAMGALVGVERAGAAFVSYWSTEVVPVLSSGFRPAIAAGLTRFVGADEVASSLREHVDQAVRGNTADEYDSHPPLGERLAALEPLAGDAPEETGPIASTLLRDLDQLEAEFLRSIFADPSKVATLQDVDWQDTGTRVYVPLWTERIAPHIEILHGISLSKLPSIAKSMTFFSKQLKLDDVELGKQTEVAQAIVGCALAVCLAGDGWQCDAAPGRTISMTKDGRTIAPFALVARLKSDELSEEEWVSECEAAGISERTLA
jgi:Zn-dependent protease with chaperone function